MPVMHSHFYMSITPNGQNQKNKVPLLKRVVTTPFDSECSAVADVHKEGRIDIIAGAFWFESPSWKRHRITGSDTINIKAYSNAS